LLLLYLYFNNSDKNNPKTIVDIIENLECIDDTSASKDYWRVHQKLRFRLQSHNIRRLAKTGLIYYESKKPEEENKYVFQKDLNKDEMKKIIEEQKGKYSRNNLYNFKVYGPKILEVLKNSEKPLSAREIMERLNIKGYIHTLLRILSKYGYIRKVEGKSRDEYSIIYLTEKGKRWIEKYLVNPDNVKVKTGLLDVLGISDVFRKYGVSYKTLDIEIEIDEKRLGYIYKVRETLGKMVKERFEEFRRRAYIARRRHQEESGNIKKFER